MQSQIDAFLGQTHSLVDARNGEQLAKLYESDLQKLSPTVVSQYISLQSELRQSYSIGKESELLWQCKRSIPKEALGKEGLLSDPFFLFVKEYLVYLRDWVADDGQGRQQQANQLAKYPDHCFPLLTLN